MHPPTYAKYTLSEFLLDGRLSVVCSPHRGTQKPSLSGSAIPNSLKSACKDSATCGKLATAQPGCRVPVPGNPTWTECVQDNLHVTERRVQQQLRAGAEPRETISLGSKRPWKLRRGGLARSAQSDGTQDCAGVRHRRGLQAAGWRDPRFRSGHSGSVRTTRRQAGRVRVSKSSEVNPPTAFQYETNLAVLSLYETTASVGETCFGSNSFLDLSLIIK